MQVSFNPVKYNRSISFNSKNVSKKEAKVKPAYKQICEAKTKKAASECFFVALAATIICISVKASSDKLAAAKKNINVKKVYEYNKKTADYFSEMKEKLII